MYLFNNCVPRDFDKEIDVQDINSLLENKIDPKVFFETSFKTQGMELLLSTAFERFKGFGEQKLIKLTQSMGGGKTHNMISLGLLCKHPEFRKKIIGNDYKDDNLGNVEVIGFSGRESHTPKGIWGELIKQLGRESEFVDLWNKGLRAPNQSEWINILKGKPKLILFDELPPYLVNAKTSPIGNGTMLDVTTTALANLFNAINNRELNNVLVVISDLTATYEEGGKIIRETFKNLEGEVHRFALHIEPVESKSDEIYDILRAKLFKELPDDKVITKIATSYKEKMLETKNLGLTNNSPESIFSGIREAYPFHPSIRELYERFRENQNFQQTRDLIRLMRNIIKNLWTTGIAKKKYLINSFDIDLNEPSLNTMILQIKSSLGNAISKDISNQGRATAEIIDKQYKIEFISQVAKIILVSSLADIPNAILGLYKPEIIGYLVEPDKDIIEFKNAFDDFLSQAWYVHSDKDGRLHFQNQRNIIAELNNLMDGYNENDAKKEIEKFLQDKFKPKGGDCYQNVIIFPAIDEIKIEENKITLILFEPNLLGKGLHPDLQKLFDDTQFKNRIMFLSGERNTMDNLVKRAKEFKAINRIIKTMKEDRVPESNTQFEIAIEREHKISLSFLTAARETFVRLYYPRYFKERDILVDADFSMNFTDNNYNAEDQIKKLLIEKEKYTTEDPKSEIIRQKFLARIFSVDEMRREDLKYRTAAYPVWQWHHPKTIDDMIDFCLKSGIWHQAGNFIQKNPPKEDTSLSIQANWLNNQSNEATLKIIPKFGDVVHYEFYDVPRPTSDKITNFSNWKTDEMVVWFLCVDSSAEHKTGAPVKWVNRLNLFYQTYDAGEHKKGKFECSNKNAKILYTTDGSEPKENGAVYSTDFIIPPNTTFILAIAEYKDIWSERLEIKIDWKKLEGLKIEKSKSLTFQKKGQFKTNNTKESYEEIALLHKHNAVFKMVNINYDFTIDNKSAWAQTVFSEDFIISRFVIENQIEFMRKELNVEKNFNANLQIESIIFKSGQDFEDWVQAKHLQLASFKQNEIVQ
jgi:hypothetical protein